MARGKKKESALTPEEKLAQALVLDWEQPYKIPENWCWTTVEKVATVITGGTPSKNHPEYYDGTFPFYKPSDLDAGRYVYEASEYLSDEGKAVSRIIPQHATAVCCIGSIGKSGYLTREGTTNQQINSAIPYFNPLYLYYFMNTDQFINELWSKASATTISIVNKSKMEQCYFPLAPLAEQQRIVDRIEYLFAKLDEAKEKAQAVLDSFETRKAAILHKAFTGELTAKWRTEHSELGWTIVTLDDVCRFETGYAFKSDKFSDMEGTPVVRISNISEMGVDVDSCILTTEVNIDKRFHIQYGDLLIAMSGATTGKNGVYLSDKIAFLNQRVGNIKIKDPSQLIPGYRNYYILHMRETILQNAYGGAQPNISSGKICSMEFPLPPFAEQQEIVRILDSLFAKEQQAKEAAEAVLEKIDLLKKSILARAFRGELGTNDLAEESALEVLKSIL